MQDPEAIALQLKKDQQLCQEQRLPSTLALRLPKPPSPLLDKIAYHLTPESEVPAALRSFRCESIIKGIKSYLNNLNAIADETNDALLSGETHTPKTEELETTLKVLEHLQNNEAVSKNHRLQPVDRCHDCTPHSTLSGQRSPHEILQNSPERPKIQEKRPVQNMLHVSSALLGSRRSRLISILMSSLRFF